MRDQVSISGTPASRAAAARCSVARGQREAAAQCDIEIRCVIGRQPMHGAPDPASRPWMRLSLPVSVSTGNRQTANIDEHLRGRLSRDAPSALRLQQHVGTSRRATASGTTAFGAAAVARAMPWCRRGLVVAKAPRSGDRGVQHERARSPFPTGVAKRSSNPASRMWSAANSFRPIDRRIDLSLIARVGRRVPAGRPACRAGVIMKLSPARRAPAAPRDASSPRRRRLCPCQPVSNQLDLMIGACRSLRNRIGRTRPAEPTYWPHAPRRFRPPARPFRLLAERGRHQGRQDPRPGARGEHAGGGDHRHRQPVRRAGVQPGLRRQGHPADHRLPDRARAAPTIRACRPIRSCCWRRTRPGSTICSGCPRAASWTPIPA